MARNELKHKVPVMFLSIASPAFMIYSTISYFSFLNPDYSDGFTFYDFLDLQTAIFKISSSIMLFLHLFIIRKKMNPQKSDPIFFGIVYAMVATFPIYINLIGRKVTHPDADGLVAGIETVFVIAIIITFTVVVVRALKRMKNRLYLIIATVVGLAANAFWLTTAIKYFLIGESVYALSSLTGSIGEAMIYYAILLYAWDYKIIVDAISQVTENRISKRANGNEK